jgi:hypothetical protein
MTFLRAAQIILLSIFLLDCSGPGQDSRNWKTHGGDRTSQPEAELSLIPPDATARSVISLQGNRSLINSGKVQWYVNGSGLEYRGKVRFSSDALKKGDSVTVVITAGDKEYHSNELIIKNTPPVIRRAVFSPQSLTALSTVTLNINADDADSDLVTFKYHWTVNGVFAGEESRFSQELKRGDIITVEVTPYDAEDYGKTIKLKREVFNSLPVVSERSSSFEGETYRYQIAATDPDNDELTFALEEGPDGMTVDQSSGIITWDAGPGKTGIYDVKISVSDNHGGKILVPFTTMVSTREE